MLKFSLNYIKQKKIHLLVLILSMLIGGFSAAKLGQDINFDLLNYHYSNPYALLHNRIEQDIAPAELESYENPLVDIPSYMFISHLSPRQAAVALGLIQGLNIWFIFEISLVLLRRLRFNQYFKKTAAFLIATLSFFGAASTSEIGNSMGENIASIFVLASLLIVLRSFSQKQQGRHVLYIRAVAYFLVGFAVGLKLTAAAYGVGLMLTGLIFEGSFRNRAKNLFIYGCTAFAGLLTSAGFWYLRLWNLLKNPIFPFYNGIFKSAYYIPVNFVDKRWFPKTLGEKIFYPFYFINNKGRSAEIPFRDPRLAVLFTLIIIIMLLTLGRLILKKRLEYNKWPREQVFFWVFLGVSYLVWLKQFGYYRYLLPVELLSLIAIALIIFKLVKNISVASTALVISFVVITLTTSPINWGRVPWQPTYFGVKKADYKQLEDSTVLIAGFAPLGFLVPYFPESSHTIRIESDLSSPSMGTPVMQQYIRAQVNARLRKGSPFYALRADEEATIAEESYNAYNFKTVGCREIPAIVRAQSISKFRLCKLILLNP
ncbi:hypothetical protein BH10PAT3_BH10PAT3_4070 [soil metagenome]